MLALNLAELANVSGPATLEWLVPSLSLFPAAGSMSLAYSLALLEKMETLASDSFWATHGLILVPKWLTH